MKGVEERHNVESWRIRSSSSGGEGHQGLDQAVPVHGLQARCFLVDENVGVVERGNKRRELQVIYPAVGWVFARGEKTMS